MDALEFGRIQNVPESYRLVCPMTLGYSKASLPPSERKEPRIFSWRKA